MDGSLVDVERIGALRRALLLACVVDGVDLIPDDAGVRLGLDAHGELLTWTQVSAAAEGSLSAAPLGSLPHEDTETLRVRLATWLAQREELRAGTDLARSDLRLLALPTGSALHPGREWVRAQVVGGALDVGFGVVGRFARSESVVPLWPDVAELTGLGRGPESAAGVCWHRERQRLEALGRIAVRRLERGAAEPGARTPAGDRPARAVLASVGGCDVLTLLSDPGVRRVLVAREPSGLAAMSVPSRSRGWVEGSTTDPAFTAAAWTATDIAERGLPRPLLVSADEVAVVRSGLREGA